MFAALMIGHHFSISAFCSAPSASGVCCSGGGTGELCYLDGAFIPFAKTKAEREATKDPRPSLAERYRDNADYSERVKAAATALERDGYLLPEDTKRIVERAAKLTW